MKTHSLITYIAQTVTNCLYVSEAKNFIYLFLFIYLVLKSAMHSPGEFSTKPVQQNENKAADAMRR